MRQALFSIAIASMLVATINSQPPVTLAKWSPGTLDIHQINTGRGNSSFLMLPDGTTLLIDAGDGGNPPPRGTAPKPDASRTPAEWIVRYLRAVGATQVDYAMLTHFHNDHMGAMPEVMKSIPVRTMLDRAWPEYDYPSRDHAEFKRSDVVAYRELLRQKQASGERFVPGRADQIVLRRDRAKYPEFSVQNVLANGEVWTGTGAATQRLFPDLKTVPQADWPTANMSSLGLRLSYGTVA